MPFKLGKYNMTEYLDEHVQFVNFQINYVHAEEASKCKVFVLTMIR